MQFGGMVALVGFLFSPISTSSDWITYSAKEGPGKGKHIVFLAGDEEYRSEEGLPMLAKILSQRHGFTCTVLFSVNPDGTINPDASASLSHPEALDKADAIIMLLRFRAWTDEAMKRFEAAYLRGVPIVALRTSTHAFRYPPGSTTSFKEYNTFGRRVLGEGWVGHWENNRRGATRGILEPSSKADPILRGVGEIFGDTGLYEVHPQADAKILVRGMVLKGMKPTDLPADFRKRRKPDNVEQPVNDPMVPVAWTRMHINAAGKTNPIFCTTMGAATDLQSEGLRRLIVNAVYWGLGIDVPMLADVSFVGDFQPSAYAPKGYKRGVKPTDLGLDVKKP